MMGPSPSLCLPDAVALFPPDATRPPTLLMQSDTVTTAVSQNRKWTYGESHFLQSSQPQPAASCGGAAGLLGAEFTRKYLPF